MALHATEEVPDLARWIRSGDTIMWGQAAAEPLTLTRALVAQRHRLRRVRVFCGIGATDTLQPEQADAFDFIGYGAAGTHRNLARAGVLDILPVHYSQLGPMIAIGDLKVDVLLLQLSPADAQGRHSLGLACEYLVAAIEAARVVIAEVNPWVPWVPGERTLTAADIDVAVPAALPPVDVPPSAPGEIMGSAGRRPTPTRFAVTRERP